MELRLLAGMAAMAPHLQLVAHLCPMLEAGVALQTQAQQEPEERGVVVLEQIVGLQHLELQIQVAVAGEQEVLQIQAQAAPA